MTDGQEPSNRASESASSRNETHSPASSSDSETRQPQSQPQSQNGQPKSESEKADAVAELLGLAPEGDQGAADTDTAEVEEENQQTKINGKLTVSELAKALDLPPEKVYNLEVTTGDGETVTLGALKDAWQGRQEAARETAKREASLDERESALIADQHLFSQLGSEVEKHLTPQAKAALRERAQVQQAKSLTQKSL